MTDHQPEGTRLATHLGNAVGGPGPDPETPLSDALRHLGEARRPGQSWAMETGTRREDGVSLLAVLGDARAQALGVDLIRAERARQVAVEGYTPEHDAHHGDGDLIRAAVAYATAAVGATEEHTTKWWPWDRPGFKPGPEPLDSLVKAGALIAAEIDRIMATTAAEPPGTRSPALAPGSPVAAPTEAGEGGWRERAEAAEGKLDEIYEYCRTYRGDEGMTLACDDILAITGTEGDEGHGA